MIRRRAGAAVVFSFPVGFLAAGSGRALYRVQKAGNRPVIMPGLPRRKPWLRVSRAQAAKASGAQGVFLSNGPGDPATLTGEIAVVRDLIKIFPVTGICLGHQLIGHALGGSTDKLKFGHHGCNHPVKDLTTGRIEISSQNHGFHVVLDGVADVEATHVNLNDHTLEGLRHKTLPVMSLQYHPEAAAGPRDGNYLFSRFREMIGKAVGA